MWFLAAALQRIFFNRLQRDAVDFLPFFFPSFPTAQHISMPLCLVDYWVFLFNDTKHLQLSMNNTNRSFVKYGYVNSIPMYHDISWIRYIMTCKIFSISVSSHAFITISTMHWNIAQLQVGLQYFQVQVPMEKVFDRFFTCSRKKILQSSKQVRL